MKETKIIFLISLLIAVSFILEIIILSIFIPEKTLGALNSNSGNSSSNPVPNLLDSEKLTLTPSEIAKHNTLLDSWMIINNKVYDITAYVNSHP